MSLKDLQANQQPIEVQQLKSRMAEIEANLIQQTPGLPTALADIHKNLLQHEELVHLLDDDDIAKLHQAHELFKQHALIQKEVKKLSAKGRGKKVSDNDLNNL